MPRPLTGAFDADLAALQRLRRRLAATPASKKRASLIKLCDQLHDEVRMLVTIQDEAR